ncbi:cytochrome b/b6 domain-containing protein [Polaromonas sp. SM01]|uniref:cytochrome b/b6 domain-containing protein n=1 Tax=Polaromonas sp. SM01 TaxID=3085630 RepID=UPI002980CF36|nr:cytochrome b/b6 domain-containing protein [Polaromonas sp. SM01]MDW5441953.1 cytochrome b/b6 domain-containing protein [Polaromonas sp. SM01]
MSGLAAPIKVWDRLIRLLHWALAAAVVMAWTSTLGLGFVKTHEPAGYIALAIVAIRVIWGFSGSRYARFSQFVRGKREVLHYAGRLRTGNEPRCIGHNPLGGWMVLLLLGLVASLGLTGWLYTTDYFWGMAWLDMLHHALAWALLVLVALHLAGVVFTSLRHGENLIAAMFSGRKPAPGPGDTV